MKRTFGAIALALIAGATMNAQEGSRFAFQMGAGFTTPVGHAGRTLDYGWNAGLGMGYNFNSHVGALVNFNYNEMGINSTTLGNIGVPGGDVNIMSFTLDPIVHLTPTGKFDLYVTGGYGLYHRNQQFTAPGVSTGFGYDPYFGFYPTAFPVTQLLYSYSVNKPGYDIGVGIAVGTKWHGKLYAEAKYNEMFNGNGYHTAFLPVTFGFRW